MPGAFCPAHDMNVPQVTAPVMHSACDTDITARGTETTKQNYRLRQSSSTLNSHFVQVEHREWHGNEFCPHSSPIPTPFPQNSPHPTPSPSPEFQKYIIQLNVILVIISDQKLQCACTLHCLSNSKSRIALHWLQSSFSLWSFCQLCILVTV